MADFIVIKIKIDSGEYTIAKRNSRSVVYDIFYNIIDSNGVVIKNVMLCTRCKNVYKANKKWTSNLLRHSCFKKYKASHEEEHQVEHVEKVKPANDLKKECMELVVQWIVGDCRPCHILNDGGLYKLAEFLINAGHQYGHRLDIKNLIPHLSKVTRNIANLYDGQKDIQKEELQSIKNTGFGITCNVWNDNFLVTTFVGTTVHYIKAGSVTHKMLGMRQMGKYQNSYGSNIRNNIINILKEFDCELNEMVTVVTDGGSSIDEAFQHDRSIICINHLLNNVIEAAVSDTAEVNSITSACSGLIKYLKKSEVNSVLNTALESCTTTIWSTTFYLLQSVQQNWDDINQILQEKNMVSRLANLNLADINEILKVLKPFHEASKLLGGENCPTIHHVYPQIRKLKTISCKSNTNESEMIKAFKEKLLCHMESVIDPNIKDLHKIALFLFPPANKLQNFQENEKRTIHKKCKEMLMAYDNFKSTSNVSEEFLDVDIDTETDAFNDFVQSAVSPHYEDELSKEISLYEKQTVLYYKQFDPLDWWESHKREYPLLYRLCSFVLATPATSSASERFFSKAPYLLSESVLERKPVGVNQIMFLHSNVDLNAPRTKLGGAVEHKLHTSDSEDSKCSISKIEK